MKIQPFLFIVFIFSGLTSFSQNDLPAREAFTLELPVDGELYYTQEVKESNYFVDDKVLQIYPGEHLFIEASLVKKEISSMKVVKENLNPENTIEISFSQNVEDGKSESMILKVVNPFKKNLKYNAMMYIVGHDQWINTSILPVQGELIGYEMWNDVIITLVLSDWELK